MSVSNELIGPQFLSYNCGEGGSSLEVFVIAWLGILSVHIVTVCIFNLFLLLAGLLQKQYFNNNELMILSSPNNQAALRKKLF